MIMKTYSKAQRPGWTGFILRNLAVLLLVALGLWLVSKTGVAPFTAAFILLFFKSLIRFLLKVACLIVLAGILVWLLSIIL